MASTTNLSATLLIFSTLLFYHACVTCTPSPAPQPALESEPPTPSLTPLTPITPTLSSAPSTLSPLTPAPSPASVTCPRDTLKLGVCVNLLGLVHIPIGTTSPCCTLLEGLVDLDVALCLCTALKANVLGVNLDVPISLSMILGACKKSIPPGFRCA